MLLRYEYDGRGTFLRGGMKSLGVRDKSLEVVNRVAGPGMSWAGHALQGQEWNELFPVFHP